MPPEVIEGMMALTVVVIIGTLFLTGMRMRLRHKEMMRPQSSTDVDQLTDTVDRLAEQVRALSEDTAELHERVDFAERLLTSDSPRASEPDAVTPV